LSRAFNFSAGPSALPAPVLEQVQEELLDWRGLGTSVMEISHRGKAFRSLAEQSDADLRTLLDVPDEYSILFLQGGAQMQFSMVPLNLLDARKHADYIDTGHWSGLAVEEARRYGTINVAASGADSGYRNIPARDTWRLDPEASYVHYTPNETLTGVEFQEIPEVGSVPLVADMSSTILSRPIDVSRFGLIYAGAQKNVGPAGITVVIVRRDLTGRCSHLAPKLFDYRRQIDAGSMANTAPTFSWYVASLVFKWLLKQGGLEHIASVNHRKSQKLYRCIDDSEGFYSNDVSPDCRSWMNVSFHLASVELDALFLSGAELEGLIGLKGHRAIGGVRASIYNAVPESAVDALVDYMSRFRNRHQV
jgi:phosphoserine aminotransferase